MSASFQILSHAGLRVNAGGKELICDPWILGSAYWRSWWNYPPVPAGLADSLRPDFIYITHLHWDHFHGPSLRRFDPNIPVIIPYDRYGRFVDDLKAVGRKNIIELRHGERLQLSEGLALRSYHVSPFCTDSAVAIEAEGVTLLNFNDAKFAGAPLRQVLRDYPNVDFCFRSHSSANARACFHEIGREDVLQDDNSHYIEAFSLFMAAVKPRYAIPFASNNCLLHRDTFGMNHLVQTPAAVEKHFNQFRIDKELETEVRVMVAGDSWSKESGFSIADHSYFTDRDAHLERYRERVSATLEKQYKLEDRLTVPLSAMRKFFAKTAKDTPKLLRRKLRNREVLIVSKAAKVQGFAVDLWNGGAVREVPSQDFAQFDARIELPALILRQSITMNMFAHAAISKRVHYYATPAAWPYFSRFLAILDWAELELIPLRSLVSGRARKSLLPRWREGLLYARALFEKKRHGLSIQDIEKRLLAEG